MTTPQPLPPADAGLLLGGRYRLVSRIASGGMGTVWEGVDETLRRPMAVKVLNEGLAADPRFAERFRREARHAAGLSHPNIAGVYDYGEDGGRPYIVMELVDGEDLAERLARVGTLDPPEVSRIGADVASALAHAHDAGIVHRDVKPANVMLTRTGDVKVTDFGIAAPLEGSTGLTVTGSVMGTSRYISPEQAQGDRATPASDVYSLGVVLYECLAGEPIFVRDSPVATALAHINDKPTPIREVRPETPPELAGAVHASLSKDPELRPSAGALAVSLEQDAGVLPIAPAVPDEDEPAPVAEPRRADDGTGTEVLPLGTVGAQRAESTRPITIVPETPSTAPAERAAPAIRPARAGDPRRPWLAGLGVAAALLLVLGVATAGGVSRMHMPKFVGLSRAEALKLAVRDHLHPRIHRQTSGAPAGIVVGQRPQRGRWIVSGSPVGLFVSTGPTTPVYVPPPHGHPKPKPPGHEKHKGKH